MQLEPVEILGRHMPDGQIVSYTRLPTVVVTGSSSAASLACASSAGNHAAERHAAPFNTRSPLVRVSSSRIHS